MVVEGEQVLKGNGGMAGNGYRISFRGDENILKLIVAMVAEHCMP